MTFIVQQFNCEMLQQLCREVTEEKATRTDLTKIHEQYFEAGHLCTSLFHNDAGELAEMLPEVIKKHIVVV